MIHENYIKDLLDVSTYTYVSRISCSIVFHKLVHNILRGTQTCTELEHSAPCNEAKPNSMNRKPSLDIILIPLHPVHISTSYWFQFILISCSHPLLHQPFHPLHSVFPIWNTCIVFFSHKHYASYSLIWLALYLKIIKHSSHSFLHSVVTYSFLDTHILLCTLS